MCGIAGIFSFNSDKPVDEGVLRRMCDVMKYRGPDDEGYYFGCAGDGGKPRFGFGMRRLSIIDLKTGRQPIHNEDKTVRVVLNGEIYNFEGLRKDLQEKGHRFYTGSDTETIVHLYEEYGEGCTEHLRGMYAFAVWDDKKKLLFIARDRLGKKPLYYTIQNGVLVFSSEIKSILEYSGIKHSINLKAINLFLTYQYIPSPQTIFNEINRLEPASVFTCALGKEPKKRRYWDIDFSRKTELSYADARTRLNELLVESTRMRLVSDVPLGAFLSGGHDSSIIVGLMSRLMSKPVKTFSIGFEEEEFSELGYARIVAKHFNTDHNEFIVKPQFVDILPKIVWHYDQPYADSSALPSYYVANVTRKHVTVALNGDGGDENFAGYLRYKAMKGSSYFSFPFRLMGRKMTGALSALIPHVETSKSSNAFRYAYRLVSALAEPPEIRHIIWHSFFTNEAKYRIYSEDMHSAFRNEDAYDYLSDVFLHAPAGNSLDRSLYTDIMTYLPEDLLVKMDIATMANSLETRSPFLDHKLVEFTASLPASWKMKGFSTKHILKDTYRDMLPPEIMGRGKQGFGIPLGKWFRNQWKDYFRDIVLSEQAIKRGYFNKAGVEELFNEHINGTRDHGYRMYALLVLELWHRVFIDKSIKVD
jgi:asparagine synthase (glutamine-hydrolysing)